MVHIWYTGWLLNQYNEDDFLFKFWLLTSFFQFTSLQVIKEKLFYLTASLDFYVHAFPCCLSAWYKSKLESKVVFIVLKYATTTVRKILWRTKKMQPAIINFEEKVVKLIIFYNRTKSMFNFTFFRLFEPPAPPRRCRLPGPCSLITWTPTPRTLCIGCRSAVLYSFHLLYQFISCYLKHQLLYQISCYRTYQLLCLLAAGRQIQVCDCCTNFSCWISIVMYFD